MRRSGRAAGKLAPEAGSGVAGFAREQREVDADLGHRPLPFVVDQFRGVPVAALSGLPVVVWLVTGLAAGSIPASYLASLRPLATLKGTFRAGGGTLRRVLVVTQFALSILLICATVVVYEQVQYMRDEQLGVGEDQVAVLATGLRDHASEALKEELLRHPGVLHVAATSAVPGRPVEQMHVAPEGTETWMPVQMLWVDPDFVEALGLRMVEGRDFSPDYPSDETEAFVINEAAARAFGLGDPVGEPLVWRYAGGQRTGTVIGIVEDFHATSLREEVAPLVLVINPSYRYLAVRVRADALGGMPAFLEATWKAAEPGRPFEAFFLEESVAALYESETRQARLFATLAGLAVVIACVGLFGLAAFAAAQRRKEIGVRKALGATMPHLLILLSREYVRLVLVAFAVAAPVAYLGASYWLRSFAYRTPPDVRLITAAGLTVLTLALLAVSFQAVRAARADPAAVLRHE